MNPRSYFIDVYGRNTILEKTYFSMMSARLFNKYSLSSLSLAALSVGFLSCGGSGDTGEGDCLPTGSRLDMVVPITDEVNPEDRGDLTIQLTGNGSDLPLAKIQGAAASPAIPAETHMIYRRPSAEKASLKGNFVIAQGQITLPGPIVVIFYGSVQVDMDITYQASTKHEDTSGTCTGFVRFIGAVQEGGGAVAGTPWSGTTGNVYYHPTGN